MSLFKAGEKDRQGRQKRLEHQGPYLRASRTGGISLRAQTRVAGVNATANTRHGLRLSARLAKKTQVALQNGRFVLRGRYGSDAAKINLSKSGVTVSTRTPSGTLNWVRPGRSSFKLAGVQLRGQKAVWLQLIHLLISLLLNLLQLVFQLVIGLFTLLVSGIGALAQRLQSRRWLAAEQSLLTDLELKQTEAKAEAERLLAQRGLDLRQEAPRDLLAALSYGLICLGRGETSFEPTQHGLDLAIDAAGMALREDIVSAGRVIGGVLPPVSDARYPALALAVTQCVAEALGEHLNESERGEALLALDDACLASAPKSLLQEAMIDHLAAAWQLHFVMDNER